MRSIARKRKILKASATSALTYTQKVVADGASNYWRLDETSGLVATDSIGGKNGTISGGVTLNQVGAVPNGKSMTFNGTTGKIATSVGIALLSPFTIELWIRRNSNSNSQVVFSNTFTEQDCLALLLIPDSLYLYGSADVNFGPAYILPYDNIWHHAVFVLAGGVGVKAYVDGILQGTPVTAPVTFAAGNARPFGMGWDASWNYLNGSLAEVAIYPLALTAQQVADHYALRL